MKPDEIAVPQIAKTVWHEFWRCKQARNEGHRHPNTKRANHVQLHVHCFLPRDTGRGGESTRAAECKANRYAHIAVIRKSQSAALAYVTTNACQHRARQLCAKCFLELLSGTVLSVLPFGKSSTRLTCQELLRIRSPKISRGETELHVLELLLIIRSTLTKVAG